MAVVLFVLPEEELLVLLFEEAVDELDVLVPLVLLELFEPLFEVLLVDPFCA